MNIITVEQQRIEEQRDYEIRSNKNRQSLLLMKHELENKLIVVESALRLIKSYLKELDYENIS